MLKALCSLTWYLKTSSFGDMAHNHEFYLQGLYRVLMMKIRERSTHVSCRGTEKVTILKYSRTFCSPYKELPSKVTILPESTNFEKGKVYLSSFPISPMEEKEKNKINNDNNKTKQNTEKHLWKSQPQSTGSLQDWDLILELQNTPPALTSHHKIL